MMSLDAIGVVCSNIDKSIKFYNQLGIQFENIGGEGHYEGVTSSGLRLMLDSVELIQSLNPKWESPTGSSPIVLCFKQENPAKVDQLYQTMVQENKVTSVKEPWDAFWGQRYSSVLDPDNNQIDIFSDL